MYVVINHLHFTKRVDEFRVPMMETGIPLLSRSPGFIDFKFVRIADDRAVVLIFWETAEDAQKGAQSFGPTWFRENIVPYLASEQQRVTGEVIAGYQL
jgi:heme-degrading monooxygenase HmoA